MLKALQKRMKRAALLDALMSSTPACTAGWFATTPTERPSHAREADDDVRRVAGLHLEEVAAVDEARDHLPHVVALLAIDGHEIPDGRVRVDAAIALDVRAGPRGCWTAGSSSSCWQMADRVPVVLGDEVRHAGVGPCARPARPAPRPSTTSPVTCLITCGPGDEHLRLPGLDDEVGQRRDCRPRRRRRARRSIEIWGTAPDSMTLA